MTPAPEGAASGDVPASAPLLRETLHRLHLDDLYRSVRRTARGLALLGYRELQRHVPWLAQRRQVTNPASPALRKLIAEHAANIARATGDPRLAEMFERQMLATWETTMRWLPGTERVFVITGDIPAMWLRDSTAQLRPFLSLLEYSRDVDRLVRGVIAQQWHCIAIDPYANSFNASPDDPTWHTRDLSASPWVWERKYEIDSLAFPVQLAWQYWKLVGETAHLDSRLHAGLRAVVELWRREQRHAEQSDYRFVRGGDARDSLPDDGRGAPVGVCGLTWAAFRPSDDRCEFGYHVPGNLFAAHACRMIAELAVAGWQDAGLAADATVLADELDAAIEATCLSPDGAYYYEVDGLGGVLLADDANLPSLLGLPLFSSLGRTDPRYQATRALVLSNRNPYYFGGLVASGIGSPHTPGRRVWPIALAVQGLTSTDRAEKLALVRTLAACDAGTGDMHESFDVDDPTDFTRAWFSWADMMFCELLLDLANPGRATLADLHLG